MSEVRNEQSSSSSPPDRTSRRPDFLVIGAARSGTTALTKFLGQHPQVFISDPKEPHFMAMAGRDADFNGPGDDVMINRTCISSIGDYEKLFQVDSAVDAVGEGSVSTLYYHEDSISNIERYIPNAKLIVILRNPVERAFSSFMYMTARGMEPLSDFATALDDEERRIAGNWHHIWHYKRMGLYADQVSAFLRAFGRERLRIFLMEDLKNDPETLFSDLLAFLGVDETFRPDTSQEINRSGNPKSKLLQSAIRYVGRTRWAKSIIKAATPSRMREKIRSANLAHPEIDDNGRKRLKEFFRGDIKKLESVIDRDLQHWLA